MMVMAVVVMAAGRGRRGWRRTGRRVAALASRQNVVVLLDESGAARRQLHGRDLRWHVCGGAGAAVAHHPQAAVRDGRHMVVVDGMVGELVLLLLRLVMVHVLGMLHSAANDRTGPQLSGRHRRVRRRQGVHVAVVVAVPVMRRWRQRMVRLMVRTMLRMIGRWTAIGRRTAAAAVMASAAAAVATAAVVAAGRGGGHGGRLDADGCLLLGVQRLEGGEAQEFDVVVLHDGGGVSPPSVFFPQTLARRCRSACELRNRQIGLCVCVFV